KVPALFKVGAVAPAASETLPARRSNTPPAWLVIEPLSFTVRFADEPDRMTEPAFDSDWFKLTAPLTVSVAPLATAIGPVPPNVPEAAFAVPLSVKLPAPSRLPPLRLSVPLIVERPPRLNEAPVLICSTALDWRLLTAWAPLEIVTTSE